MDERSANSVEIVSGRRR